METMITNDVPSTQCLPPPLTDPLPAQSTTSTVQTTQAATVTVEDPPISFSPFSLADCMLLSHFSFNYFIAIAFLDLAGDLDAQI